MPTPETRSSARTRGLQHRALHPRGGLGSSPRQSALTPWRGVPGPVLLRVPIPTMVPDVLSLTLPKSLARFSLKPPQSTVSGSPPLSLAARPIAAQLEHLPTESGQHQSLLHDPHVCPKAWLRGPTADATPDERMKA